MAVYNLGSINADHIYTVSHLPKPGETLSADGFKTGLGGKGANQSVAVARAGSDVVHIGAIGADGRWAKDRISEYGVDTRFINTVDVPTGHAIINVDRTGENAIVIFSGANLKQDIHQIKEALRSAKAGDILLLQNETSHQVEAAKIAADKAMIVIYSAAPFSVDAVKNMLCYTTIIVMNQVESEQLRAGLETDLAKSPVKDILVTKGADGVDWISMQTGKTQHVPSISVSAVDTTAAGDTFAGYFAAGLDQGMDVKVAMQLGSAAAGLKVTRKGTADAIPMRVEVNEFSKENQ